MFMTQEIISVMYPQKQEILTVIKLVFAGAMRTCNVPYWETLAVLTPHALYTLIHRRADSGPPPQISLTIEEVLPHSSGFARGGVPDTLCRRWQALQRRV